MHFRLILLSTVLTSNFVDLLICARVLPGGGVDVVSLLRILMEEHAAGGNHDIILSGNFDSTPWFSGYTPAYQIAVQNESWFLENSSHFHVTNLPAGGNSLVLVFLPSTREHLFTFIDHVSQYFKDVDTTKTCRRIYLVIWPVESSAHGIQKELREWKNSNFFWHTIKLIRLNDEVYVVAWKTLREDQIMLTGLIELYGIRGRIPVVQSIPFSRQSPLHMEELISVYIRRKDLRGVGFKVVGQPDKTYDAEIKVVIDRVTRKVSFCSGSSVNFLNDFIYNLNFTYEAIAGTGWITPALNGSGLTGMGQQLLEKQADLVISTSTLEAYRAEFIRFLQPVNSEEAKVFFRQPPVASTRTVFVMPFSPQVWLYIFVAGISLMSSAVLFTLAKETPFRHVGTSTMYSRYQTLLEDMTAAEVCIWTIGIFCQQGWCANVLKPSLRVVFLTALVTSLLLYAFYTGAFVAAISQPSPPVKEFTNLIQFDFDIIVNPDEPAYSNTFARDQSESSAILEASKRLYTSEKDAVRQVVLGSTNVAYIVVVDTFYAVGLTMYKDHELCEVEKLGANQGARVKDAMIVRKDSEFKELFAHQVVLLIERGLARRYWITYAKQMRLYCLKRTVHRFELAFHDCYSAFAILSLGYILALVLTFIEKHYSSSVWTENGLCGSAEAGGTGTELSGFPTRVAQVY